ncbi:DNA-directed RNA polymerase subunit delta [Bacillus timonensis]|uniref:DNA-directed RNA polymerase subunit delta n=1 Tax=Bacillus timonensis TaxID=1033734 RepID=A0A4S3PTW8_9BACI|nr:S-adenosyl-l-methionine hydroxide adenosyltransferase family protein [Bacillus timonensis]THE13189.1 DNA-directed RNA polymerase subunit delta [Bacillus timonensis]
MKNHLVVQTDFGLSDGAVSAMYGVAISVDPTLRIFDLTHDIPKFNIWEASYRLYQTIFYWPEGTVFVSVVDPGVGSDRRSIVVKTETNQYIVTPDNGTVTHILKKLGIKEVRIIDESINRLPFSGESYTFHGRDVYVYTGARLASGVISYEEVGPLVPVESLVQLPISEASIDNETVFGNIDVLDVRFGNLWTNIDRTLFNQLGNEYGDGIEVMIEYDGSNVYKSTMKYGRSFADSGLGEPILYINSLDKIAVALNQESIANKYKIGTGAEWKIKIRKIR